jgi:SAM-dependent methyltransferase
MSLFESILAYCRLLNRLYLRVLSPVAYLARQLVVDSFAAHGKGAVRCLDIGAGNAPYRRDIESVFGISEYIAVDVVPLAATTVVASAESLPLETAMVDMVVSFDSIQHFADSGAAMNEITRVLQPGGIVLMTFPFLYGECDFKDYKRWTLDGMSSEWGRRGFEVLIIRRRGGRCFAVVCLVAWALQHILPGQRTSWRSSSTTWTVFRGIIMLIFSVPLNLLGFIAICADRFLPTDTGLYMGGSIVLRKAFLSTGLPK